MKRSMTMALTTLGLLAGLPVAGHGARGGQEPAAPPRPATTVTVSVDVIEPEAYAVTYTNGDESGTASSARVVVVRGAPAWGPRAHPLVERAGGRVQRASFDRGSVPGIAGVRIVRVTSDEADDAPGAGDGETAGDALVAPGCRSVRLRRERDRAGDGRVYAVTVSVRDTAGTERLAVYRVTVPLGHQDDAAIEGPPASIVTSDCPY